MGIPALHIPALPASLLTWGLHPYPPIPAHLLLSRLERGPGIGPSMPRDSKIFIKLDAHILETKRGVPTGVGDHPFVTPMVFHMSWLRHVGPLAVPGQGLCFTLEVLCQF